MKQLHIEMVYELIDEAKKLDKYSMTRREFREFEIEVSQALENYVVREPLERNDGGFDCPCCGTSVQYSTMHQYAEVRFTAPITVNFKYCMNCGQRLDWDKKGD